MIDRLKKILNESACDGWQIRDVRTEGLEYYFIRHELDQNRINNTEHAELTVFKKSEDGKYIGSASAEVFVNDDDSALKAKVKELIYRASLVRNPIYPLNAPKQAEPFEVQEVPLNQTAKAFIQLMEQIDETESEDINSYEIFVSSKTERFASSEGIDVCETYPVSMAEVIVNARNGGHEIELYRAYRSGTCDETAIKDDLNKTMQYGRDRLKAEPTPNLKKFPVIFSGENAVTVCGYFLDKTDAELIYRKMSGWKKGEPYAKELLADKVTVKARRFLNNSPSNRIYDREGAPVREATFIEDGIVCGFHGRRMFSSYIGNEDSFILSNYEVSGGTHSEAEIRSGAYLEAVDFSDFQVDPLTGDIFGEIRLAYLHQDGRVTPVSGGSVSGNMHEFVKTMKMSRDMKQYGNAYIPALIRLEDVTLSGSEE